jgi:hypothetical protein
MCWKKRKHMPCIEEVSPLREQLTKAAGTLAHPTSIRVALTRTFFSMTGSVLGFVNTSLNKTPPPPSRITGPQGRGRQITITQQDKSHY